MAEAGESEPAPPEGPSEGQAEAKPKRYPRSRVRADGARRRTQAQIEARRKAKREGAGYWAGKGGGRSRSGRPTSAIEKQFTLQQDRQKLGRQKLGTRSLVLGPQWSPMPGRTSGRLTCWSQTGFFPSLRTLSSENGENGFSCNNC